MAKPHFLNVDLEIESASKLDVLVAGMGNRVSVLYSGPMPKRGRHFLALEISRFCRDPDATIHALCSVIDELFPAARRIWDAARKTFDVGYELRPSERSSHFTLRPDTLKRIVGIGSNLAVTYYRGEADDDLVKTCGKKRKAKRSG